MNALNHGYLSRCKYSFGPRHYLISSKFPEHRTRQGILDIPRLARELRFPAQAMYQSLIGNRLSLRVAQYLVQPFRESDAASPILREELFEFVLLEETAYPARKSESRKFESHAAKSL
jgi:hypothetical protein